MANVRNVLLYGTSANPPTGWAGHVGAAAHFKSMYDEIWIIPVYQHMFASKRKLAPFHHRVEMGRLAFGSLDATGANSNTRKE